MKLAADLTTRVQQLSPHLVVSIGETVPAAPNLRALRRHNMQSIKLDIKKEEGGKFITNIAFLRCESEFRESKPFVVYYLYVRSCLDFLAARRRSTAPTTQSSG
jgi:hypothetical protein